MALATEKVFNAIAYYRLSKDDGDKHESDSIVNQRKLVHGYVAQHSNLRLIKEAQDDGFTGTNYNRPGFSDVMSAIKRGEIDCVIVKDLSRLGREYIETGKYLEMVFPSFGVRFIAINDDVDSENHSQSDDLVIPIKNLINESYCRELSKKLRAQFKIQRCNGEFLGAFASYGYRKSPDDKHKLIIDEYAAEVVRGIFAFKMQGYSQQAIAEALNKMGVLPPAEYKTEQGLNYKSGFSSAKVARWSAVTVKTILTNRLYVGDLIQGKRGTANYKVKKVKVRDESEWAVVKGNHEAIIHDLNFQVIQKLLTRDTRTSPTEEIVQPLAGVLFCPDCQRAMCRRSVTRGNKKFFYYICSSYKYKRGEGCQSHSLEQGKLERAVLHALQQQIQVVVEADSLLQAVSQSDLLALKQKRLHLLIAEKEKELNGLLVYKTRLYESLCEALIDKSEYNLMWGQYSKRIALAQAAISALQAQLAELESGADTDRAWLGQFLKYRNINELRRETVATLIDKVYVYEDKRLHIEFNFRDELADFVRLTQNALREVG